MNPTPTHDLFRRLGLAPLLAHAVIIVLCPPAAQAELLEELRERMRSLGADPEQAADLADGLLALARLHLFQIASGAPSAW